MTEEGVVLVIFGIIIICAWAEKWIHIPSEDDDRIRRPGDRGAGS